ncbi:hypothetical protein C8R44DRAFT_839148, partial [Mycena epipterygia]
MTSMRTIIHLQDLVIKSLSKPHDDIPSDMQMSAQLIVDGHIFLQTVPVNSESSQNSWKLGVDCKVPPHAHVFLIAIMRHSKVRGIRLLGYIKIGRGEVIASVQEKSRFCRGLAKVNLDGPSLELSTGFSISRSSTTEPSGFKGINMPKDQVGSLTTQMILARLEEMYNAKNSEIPIDSAGLWVMHERILLLSGVNEARARFLNIFGDICLRYHRTSQVINDLNQGICAYEDAMRDGLTDASSIEDLGIALGHRFHRLGDLSDVN